MIKKGIKVITFLILLVSIMAVTFRYCAIKDDVYSYEVWDDFYSLPENSVDVMLLGGSGIREYYCAPEAFEHTGIASYALATGNQPFGAIKYLIEEIEKTQKPKLYVIDIRMLIYDSYDEAAVRRVTDGMRQSWNRIKTINTLLNRSEEGNERINLDYLSHYFKFPMYHSQWEEVENGKRKKNENVWMGFNIYDAIEPFEPLRDDVLEAEPVNISDYNENLLKDLLDYCNGLDAEVLFVNVPSMYGEKEFGMFNYSKSIIMSKGYEVLDLNYYVDDMELDYSHDFKNYYHVNVWGAMKVTDYLADYCVKRYYLVDHSSERKYSLWTDACSRFIDRYLVIDN